MTHEAIRPQEFVLPAEIASIITHSLQPAEEDMVAHGNTRKFHVAGHPDLYVRRTPGQTTQQAQGIILASRFIGHGLHPLPAHVVENNYGDAYIVTQRVTGMSLLNALSSEPDEVLLATVDHGWAGLSKTTVEGRCEGRLIPTDVYTPDQYMLGTTTSDPQTKIRLVDFPESTYQYGELTYAETLVYIANGIISIEQACGTEMSTARTALTEALQLIDTNMARAQFFATLATGVLERGIEILPTDEDQIEAAGFNFSTGLPDRTQ